MRSGETAGSGRVERLDPSALSARFAARDAAADGQVRNIDVDDLLLEWLRRSQPSGRSPLVEEETSRRQSLTRTDQLRIARPRPRRRRRSALKHRRPSILLRRTFTKLSLAAPVHRGEREIIARE